VRLINPSAFHKKTQSSTPDSYSLDFKIRVSNITAPSSGRQRDLFRGLIISATNCFMYKSIDKCFISCEFQGLSHICLHSLHLRVETSHKIRPQDLWSQPPSRKQSRRNDVLRWRRQDLPTYNSEATEIMFLWARLACIWQSAKNAPHWKCHYHILSRTSLLLWSKAKQTSHSLKQNMQHNADGAHHLQTSPHSYPPWI
jgi:hypothetical protein